MKFTEIADYQVRPGAMTRWTVVPAAAARPRDDDRPPSHLQEDHLRNHAAAETAQPSWLAVGFDLPGELDETALRAAVLRWLDRHESLRSELTHQAGELRRRTWGPGRLSLSRKEIGDFDADEEITAELRAMFNAHTDPTGWPSYVFATISRADSVTLCMAFDHGNVDGYSILLAAHEVQELYAAEREGRGAELAEVGSYVDFCAEERVFTDGFERSDEIVGEWADFVASCGGELPSFPLPLAGADLRVDPVVSGFSGPQRGFCRRLLDEEGADALETSCRRNGGSVYSGVLATLGTVANLMSQQTTFRTLLLLHTRSAQRWAQSVGWFVGVAPIQLRTPESITGGADVLEMLPTAGNALRTAKPLSAVPLPKVSELLGTELVPRFVLSYMDMRASPGACNWDDWNAQALHAPATSADEVYLWVNRNHNGIDVTCRFPGTAAAAAVLDDYVHQIRRLLRAVAVAGLATTIPPMWTESAPERESAPDAVSRTS
ncbi:hypothetical protein INP57_09055 [Saccharopolyspora sp. HNM0986]|uniref:condensation domain-containing protein n=1 Tax=Saccharopolyspora galaxeae TaxID=2781241 RepID=UPI00190ADC2A|nr:condensation domain-containing protein [Saccharopolyspora sp. HNM0986]MBK0866952.1 hypothetical protein [Saccharopolyspora sp. HNM0986]